MGRVLIAWCLQSDGARIPSSGGAVAGKATILLNGKAGGACTLTPTGGWDTYKNLTCGEPGRYSANTGTGMMPDLGFNFTGPVTEFARVDALNWIIYD